MNKQESFENKLMEAQVKLSSTKDQVYVEKAKWHKAMQEQFGDQECALAKVQNNANILEETNNDLRDELKQVLIDKHRVSSVTAKAKQLASDQLEKWHVEWECQHATEDEVFCLEKLAKQTDQIIGDYRLEIELSKNQSIA
jgi:hypothetical protein